MFGSPLVETVSDNPSVCHRGNKVYETKNCNNYCWFVAWQGESCGVVKLEMLPGK